MNVQQTLLKATKKLKKKSSSPALDAELLLAYVLGKSIEFLFTYPSYQLTSAQQRQFSQLITRRQKREPVAYILGYKEFFGLNFTVNKNVLIPRPETELLVEEVIQHMKEKTNPYILDVGVGSGAIAIAVKTSLPQASVYGTDSSRKALEIAKKNAQRLKTKITFKYGSLISPFSQKIFDCIVSNPPYLTAQEMKNPDLRYEPESSLNGGKKGLVLYADLLKQAKNHLRPGGYIILEIGYHQTKPIIALTKIIWSNTTIQIIKDLSGLERILVIQPENGPGVAQKRKPEHQILK